MPPALRGRFGVLSTEETEAPLLLPGRGIKVAQERLDRESDMEEGEEGAIREKSHLRR